jgi:glycogen operon protein
MEWNDRFRDVMRNYWIGTQQHLRKRGDFAMRLCGSSDLYQHRQRRQRPPTESVNYVVSHDGFTLLDLVSYNERHNHANGEDNRDGHGDNYSSNCGQEGPSDDPVVRQRRARLQRALLATMLLAQGTPMLCAGDELGHTQHGNNNPYCQDNAGSWIDWLAADASLIAFTAWVLALRHAIQPFRNHWYNGEPDAQGLPDIAWLQSDGCPLEGQAWSHPTECTLGCMIGRPGAVQAPILLLVNAESGDHDFTLPAGTWQVALDSSSPQGDRHWPSDGGPIIRVLAHSLVLLVTQGTPLPPVPAA